VRAIGPKIWPSTPCIVNSGRNAAMVMMHREQDRLVDLDRADQHAVEPCVTAVRDRLACGGLGARGAEDVLHHDHGRVDDDAEIDRADREEVGGFPALAP
jgi:hypothetical protein